MTAIDHNLYLNDYMTSIVYRLYESDRKGYNDHSMNAS